MLETYKVLVTSAKNCTAEIYLNGIPLYVVSPEKSLFDSKTVNQFVVSGDNTLEAIIFPGPKPTLASQRGETKTFQDETGLSIKLSDYPRGAYAGSPGVILLGQVDFQIPIGTEYETPIHIKKKIKLGHTNLAPWSWEQTPNFSLDDDLKKEAIDLLKELQLSLNNGDPEPFIRASEPRFKDIATAYHFDVEDRKTVFREQLFEFKKNPNWEMENIIDKEVELRMCAENRMIDCLNSEWEPILHSKKNEKGQIDPAYPIKLSVLNGELKIVR